MALQVPDWNLLLAQTEQAAKNLVSSTGYDGDVLIIEQPRNARLFKRGLREATRNRLGIKPDQKVILYAPTWRTTTLESPRGTEYLLDPHRLSAISGCIVLVRSHHMTDFESNNSKSVIDVTHEPRIEDLMLASDLLLSDYSSVFFDYALLGRPMIAFVPDIVAYSSERGLYGSWPSQARVATPRP